MLEKRIEAHLVKCVRELGGYAYKFSSPGNKGVTDRIILMPPREGETTGQIWFVEIKQDRGRLSALQELFGQICFRFGLNHRVLWNRDQVNEFIAEIA